MRTAIASLPRASLAGLFCLVAVLLCIMSTTWLAAQEIRGTVVEEGTSRVVTGGFVVLLDEAGVQRDAALTDAEGRFELDAPTPGRYSLGLDRIGYLSVTTSLFPLAAGQTIEYRLAVIVLPVELVGIDVTIEPDCRVRPGDEFAVARVWEEARKALTATAWTLQQGLLSYSIVGRERTLDPYTLKVRDERAVTRQGVSRGSPYVAREADLLAREGYARVDEDIQTYFAPDAATLLSDAFLDRHCFRLRPSHEGEPRLLGLAFEPVEPAGPPDIEGTLWLDRESAELRHIEFGYTGLPERVAARAGGRVEFARLATGEWIIRRWEIRMPVFRRPDEGIYSHLTMDPASRTAALLAIEEDSGEVERIVPFGGRQAAPRVVAPLPSEPIALIPEEEAPPERPLTGASPCRSDEVVVRGTVRDAVTGVKVPEARVMLSWQAGSLPAMAVHKAVTDAEGRYADCAVLPGRATAIAFSPLRYGAARMDGSEGTETVELDLLVAAVDAARMKSELTITPGPAGEEASVLTGTVRDGITGEALRYAQIVLEGLGRGTIADEDGRFRIDDVPVGRRDLSVQRLGYEDGDVTVDVGRGPVSVDARLVPTPIAMAALELEIPAPAREVERRRGESRYVLTRGEIPENTTWTIGEILARRMPGVRHATRGGCPVLLTRDGPVGLVVLDNQRIYDTCVLNLVRPEDVERVELLPSIAASIEYGLATGGGVLIVETRRGGGS